jgi:putative ABC transport system ATP-binding protein
MTRPVEVSAVRAANPEPMISVEGLRHRYGDRQVLALDAWRAEAGERWLVLGASGSGKTTLLGIVGGLLRPSAGRVTVDGQDLAALSGAALDEFRGRRIGFVPQKLHLIPSLGVADNLVLAQYLAGVPQDRGRVAEVLGALGIADRAGARPAELSHGQAQRVALARAVINRPSLILADEPTSNLDDERCAQAVELLESQAAACGATLVVATHDQRVRARFEKRIEL